MTSDLVVDVDERFRVSSAFEVNFSQDALVAITLEVIQAPPVLIGGRRNEQEAFDGAGVTAQPDDGVAQSRTPP